MKKAIIALSMFITLAACHANYDKSPSGLVYKIFPGKGGAKLATAKFVKFNISYTIKHNGKDSILQSTFGKFPQFVPMDTAQSRIAYSYMEVLLKCSVGDSAEFSISIDTLRNHNVNLPPKEFPKGEFIKGRIKVLNSFMSKEAIMEDVKKEQALEEDKESKVIADYLAKNNITAQKTKNGAYVLVQDPGTGPKADTGKVATVKYRGYLMENGKVFDTNMDSSKGHAQPIAVTVGAHGVIPGWEEGLPYLGKGGKAKFFIPPGLGYGPQGSGEIPPNANLVFDIEVVDVKDAPPPAPQQPMQMQGMPQHKMATPPPATKPAAH